MSQTEEKLKANQHPRKLIAYLLDMHLTIVYTHISYTIPNPKTRHIEMLDGAGGIKDTKQTIREHRHIYCNIWSTITPMAGQIIRRSKLTN
jgi:hypothetical protein